MSLHSSPPAELIAAIHRGQRFYVTSHQRPDGDAIGSAVGMALALQALGKQATVVTDAMPPAFLSPSRRSTPSGPRRGRRYVDAVALMECSSLSRTGVAGLDRSPSSTSIITRATPSTARSTGSTSRQPPAASMVFTLLDALGAPLSADIATHVYLAILTDTGSFHFSHLTPRTFEICRAAASRPAPIRSGSRARITTATRWRACASSARCSTGCELDARRTRGAADDHQGAGRGRSAAPMTTPRG